MDITTSLPVAIAYIGLGSNLDSPVEQVETARQEIAALDGLTELAFSKLYASPPMGPQDQPDYVNAVMAVTTRLAPLELLHKLQGIENAHGRLRDRRWGARTLDLDILLYGENDINGPELSIPHVGIAERAFVLQPLSDCAPDDFVIPGKGRLADLLAHCPGVGLRRLN